MKFACNSLLLTTLLLSLVLCPRCARADLPASVDSAFARGQYEQVELLVLRQAAQLTALPASDRVRVELTAGYALIMLGREADAREHFRRALDADPNTRLDPVRISPKFRTVFDDVKATYRRETRPLPVVASGPRPRAVLLNLALPGTGQMIEGRPWRGTILFTAQLAAAGVLVWRLDELRQSRHAYIHQTTRSRVPHDYDVYAADTRAAWIAGAAAGVVYLAAQTDLALLPRRSTGQSLTLAPLHDGAALALSVSW